MASPEINPPTPDHRRFAIVFDEEKHAEIWPHIFDRYFHRQTRVLIGPTAQLLPQLLDAYKDEEFAGTVLDLHFGIDPKDKEIAGIALWRALSVHWKRLAPLRSRSGRVLLYSVNTSGTDYVRGTVQKFRQEVDADYAVGLPMRDRIRAIQRAFLLTPDPHEMDRLDSLSH